MKSALYYLGLICISLMLFVLHSAFAYAINPLFLAQDFFYDLFLFAGIDFKMYFPYVFGATFALAISAIMSLMQKGDKRFWLFAFAVATMELVGIALLVFPSHGSVWLAIAGIYYGIYLFIAILFYFYIKPDKHSSDGKYNVSKEFADLFVDDLANDLGVPKKVMQSVRDKDYKGIASAVHQPLIDRTTTPPLGSSSGKNNGKVMELYSNGAKPSEIAKELQVNASTVYRIIKKNSKKKDD